MMRLRDPVTIVLVSLLSVPAWAAMWRVTNYGVDSSSCGTASSPCRTISQAVLNANPGDTVIVGPGIYGDTNNDGDLLDPGEENSGISGKMIVVDKPLVLISSASAAATLVRAPSSMVAVSLEANGIAFGKKGKGFTVRGTVGGTGIEVGAGVGGITIMGNVIDGHAVALGKVDGSGHQIRNNWWTSGFLRVYGSGLQVRDNLFVGAGLVLEPTTSSITVDRNHVQRSSGVGIDIEGSNHLIRRNTVAVGLSGAGFRCQGTCTGVQFRDNVSRRNNGHGFEVLAGSGHVFTGNVASGNQSSGFYVNLSTPAVLTFLKNAAMGNNGAGFTFQGASDNVNLPTLTNCAAIGNQGEGILVAGYLVVQKSSIYGNQSSSSNCGLNKSSTLGNVLAQQNFWGAPSGPGPDPADQLCGQTGLINAGSPASSEIPVTVLRNP